MFLWISYVKMFNDWHVWYHDAIVFSTTLNHFTGEHRDEKQRVYYYLGTLSPSVVRIDFGALHWYLYAQRWSSRVELQLTDFYQRSYLKYLCFVTTKQEALYISQNVIFSPFHYHMHLALHTTVHMFSAPFNHRSIKWTIWQSVKCATRQSGQQILLLWLRPPGPIKWHSSDCHSTDNMGHAILRTNL